MTRRQFSRECEREAVHLVTVRGASVAQAARDLDEHSTVLRRWIEQFGSDPTDAVPGKGQMTPADDEVRRPRREVATPKAEKDIPSCHRDEISNSVRPFNRTPRHAAGANLPSRR